MARSKQTARRSTKASTNVELLEENQMLRDKVYAFEMEIEVMKKRCNCGSLSNSKAKRLHKLKNVILELDLVKTDVV